MSRNCHWRAVDKHGQVLDVVVQERRDTGAAERFFRVLLGHSGRLPDQIVTNSLASDGPRRRAIPS